MRLNPFLAGFMLMTVARSQTVPGFPAPVAFNPSILGPAASPAVLGPAAALIPSILGPATDPAILTPALLPTLLGPATDPSVLGPALLPSLLPPSTVDLISPECIETSVEYFTCIMTNGMTCSSNCSSTDQTDGLPTCDNIASACQDLVCCPACVATGKAFIACESNARGCGTDCSNVAPVAPVTPSPVPPISPSSQDFCRELTLTYSACLVNNLLPCGSANCTTPERPDAAICDDITSLCTFVSCCDECSNEGKALGACFSDVFQCESDCGSYSPVAPAGINYTLPPALIETPSATIPTTEAPASTPPVVPTTTGAPVSDAPVVPTSTGNTTKAPSSSVMMMSPSVAVLLSFLSATVMQSFMV